MTKPRVPHRDRPEGYDAPNRVIHLPTPAEVEALKVTLQRFLDETSDDYAHPFPVCK